MPGRRPISKYEVDARRFSSSRARRRSRVISRLSSAQPIEHSREKVLVAGSSGVRVVAHTIRMPEEQKAIGWERVLNLLK